MPDLELPEADKQVTHAQLAAQGAIVIIVALCRAALAADPSQFSVLVLDEAWSVLQVDPGARWVATGPGIPASGSRPVAGLAVTRGHPELIRDQLGVRAVFHVEAGERDAALRFLGLPPDSHATALLSSGGGGRCLLRTAGAVSAQCRSLPW